MIVLEIPERNSNVFFDHVQQFSNNLIQFDRIKNKIIYFLEIDSLDVSFLNENVKIFKNAIEEEMSNPLRFISEKEFKFFTFDELLDDKNVSNVTKNLLEFINVEDFLRREEIEMKENKKEKILFLDMHNEIKTKSDKWGFFLYFSLFSGLYRTSNENWIYKRPYEDTIPDISDILNDITYKAIIVPGSILDVFDEPQKEHILKSIEFLKKFKEAFENIESFSNKNIRILGICFGHQLIAHSYGGIVKPREGGMITRIENLKFTFQNEDQFQHLNFLRTLLQSENFNEVNVCESHLAEVSIPPPDKYFNVISFSESCRNEIIISKDRRFLTFQGHPEYNPYYRFFETFDETKMSKTKEEILKDEKEYLKNHMEKFSESTKTQKICYGFLKFDFTN